MAGSLCLHVNKQCSALLLISWCIMPAPPRFMWSIYNLSPHAFWINAENEIDPAVIQTHKQACTHTHTRTHTHTLVVHAQTSTRTHSQWRTVSPSIETLGRETTEDCFSSATAEGRQPAWTRCSVCECFYRFPFEEPLFKRACDATDPVTLGLNTMAWVTHKIVCKQNSLDTKVKKEEVRISQVWLQNFDNIWLPHH
jgi:hypothetical protein